MNFKPQFGHSHSFLLSLFFCILLINAELIIAVGKATKPIPIIATIELKIFPNPVIGYTSP